MTASEVAAKIIIEELQIQIEYHKSLLSWAYSKLHNRTFSDMEDALALDEIKLVLTGAYED